MKAVICANGKGSRWENYLGVTKHMIEIDGEPILHRTVRLLKNYGFKDIVISTSNPDYAVEGAALYTPKRNVWLIDQYPLELLTEPVLFLLGDVYFTETAIRGILTAPENPWTFFDTNCPTKSWTEQVAVKINDFENFAKAEQTVNIEYTLLGQGPATAASQT